MYTKEDIKKIALLREKLWFADSLENVPFGDQIQEEINKIEAKYGLHGVEKI